jgi:hypothetical protein
MSLLSRVVPGPFKSLARTWIDHLGFERKLRQATPVVVFQMGKVGSRSVYESLSRQYAGAVVHTHLFQADHPDRGVRRLHRWALAETRPLNIISLTREPVGRNVSAFFQCFQFDKNIRANFDIDVFAEPFPENGVAVYTRNNIRLLVLRSEIADALKVRAIGDFLGLARFQLANTNLAAAKDYAAMYHDFQDRVHLPIGYVERMCLSRYFAHFYDEATLSAVRGKWCLDQGI